MNRESKKTLEATLKSKDTEEFLDIHYYRPLGYAWAIFFKKIGVTPNQITIASIFIGVAGGICFYFTDLWINLLGVFLLIWANTYDSADGQLVRMTNRKSEWGRILDGACGDFWFISIYLALIFRLWPQYGYGIVVLAVAAGYFHSKQAALADYYRNIHLFFLNGKEGSELDTSEEIAERLHDLNKWKHPLFAFFEWAYWNYTKGQEAWTPKMQALLRVIKSKFHSKAPDWFCRYYRKKSLRYLKYTNMLSFNLRSLVLFASVLANCPWVYFIFELTVLNGVLIYMVNRYERIAYKFRGGLLHDEF
ncbi:hypothetical protein AGMMS50262_00270 [Bacteroidia bacterium]|nr:hypothetical protein AGMMS50262_00270 [Bacteroidia bacterium]